MAFIFLVGVPLLSFGKAAGLPINLSATVLAACLGIWALGASKIRLNLRPHTDLFLLAGFVAFALLGVVMNSGVWGLLPNAYFLHTIALLILCPLCYLAGRQVGRLSDETTTTKLFHAALLVVLFCMVTQNRLFPMSDDPLVAGSYYQFAGDSIAAGLIICYTIRKGRLPFSLVVATLVVLMLLGSRATFISIALASLTMRYSRRIIFSLFLVYGFLFFCGGWLLEQMEKREFMPRVAVTTILFVQDRLDDQSLKDRGDYRSGALAAIESNPIFGNYGYEYALHGTMGTYDHSILDVWVQFGLLPFLCLSGLLVVVPLKIGSETVLGRGRLGPARHGLPGWVYLAAQFFLFRHPESVVLFITLGAMHGLSVRQPGMSRVRKALGELVAAH